MEARTHRYKTFNFSGSANASKQVVLTLQKVEQNIAEN